MATVFYRNNGTGNIVATWKIVENEHELIKMLPYNEQIISKFNNFRNQSRKLEWLASRVLLYKYTGLIPDVEYFETGKPYISRLNKNISITHTHGYAAIAISDSPQTGVDIEQPKDRILRVTVRFIHPEEADYIPHNNEINYYTLIWCAKETLFKMINNTGIDFKDELKILPFKIENEGIIKTKALQSEYFLSYINTPDYILVWHC